MFERFTEKARRAIFFARYEASQYGSPYIESEHLLLGVLREDRRLAPRLLRQLATIHSICKEIESQIRIRERSSTSFEVPLTQVCKRILNYATEEAERLGSPDVGTEHELLGILREGQCLAAKILRERGLSLQAVRESIAGESEWLRTDPRHATENTLRELAHDLQECWNQNHASTAADLFAASGVFVDTGGKEWKGQGAVGEGLAAMKRERFTGLHVQRASLNCTLLRDDVAILDLDWELAPSSGPHEMSRIRMTLVTTEDEGLWRIAAAHWTEVKTNTSP